MAFNDDSVKSKLSALNETQESIVSVAQYLMFYRRFAGRTAELWLEKVRESNTSKRLNLVYLANEVMQQAKVRKKEDFLVAFMPIIAEGTALAYKGATLEVQAKIRRVVEVWRQRQILERGIQEATESRIDELDKSRSSRSTGSKLGGTLFGSSSVPPELQGIATAQGAVSKAETGAKPLMGKATADYAEHHKTDATALSPPVQAGRLSALMKSLASAEAAVSDSLKARQQLVDGLETLLATHRGKLEEEQVTKARLSQQRSETEVRRKEVEDIIFRRVSAEDAEQKASAAAAAESATNSHANGPDGSPEVEGFTPPPPEVETLTPPPVQEEEGKDYLEVPSYAADTIKEEQPAGNEPPPAFEPPPALTTNPTNGAAPTPALGADLLSSLNLPGMARPSSTVTNEGADPRKRRKMSHKEPDLDEQMFANGEGIGLDEDVAASLGAQ